ERLAGFHAHGPEADLAFLREDGLDDVEVAAGDTGAGDEQVGALDALADAGGEGVHGVAGHLEDPRGAAEGSDLGGEAEGVGVVDLAGLARFAGAEELVAGAEDGDDGTAVDADGVEAERGEDAG